MENLAEQIANKVVEKISTITEEIQTLYESSWTRVLSWINGYDIATITAFRDELKDITPNTHIPSGMEVGDKFSLKLNRENNNKLKAKLLSLGYGVTPIHGSYIEGIGGANKKEVAEESFFVVNLKNDKNFKSNLFKLADYFNQDSFLYKAKGDKDAYLVGANNNGFPEYGGENSIGELSFLPSKFMSRIRNSAFAFVDKNNWIVKQNKEDLTDDDMNDFEHSYSWSLDSKPSFSQRKDIRRKAYNDRMKSLKMAEDYKRIKDNGGIVLEDISTLSPKQKQAISSIIRDLA